MSISNNHVKRFLKRLWVCYMDNLKINLTSSASSNTVFPVMRLTQNLQLSVNTQMPVIHEMPKASEFSFASCDCVLVRKWWVITQKTKRVSSQSAAACWQTKIWSQSSKHHLESLFCFLNFRLLRKFSIWFISSIQLKVRVLKSGQNDLWQFKEQCYNGSVIFNRKLFVLKTSRPEFLQTFQLD